MSEDKRIKKLLWVADAVCDSGFARVTHEVLRHLHTLFEVKVLGINYRGDPHTYPYDIYPAFVPGCGDFMGGDRIAGTVKNYQPDAIILQNDPWNIPGYFEAMIKELKDIPPVVGIVAVDGKNCAGHLLNDLSSAIFWTKFGLREAVAGGFNKPGVAIPLGVDLEIYKPLPDRLEARRSVGLPTELLHTYIVGNANRNQPRKRMDLTVKYFCEWAKEFKHDDAYLFLHISPTGDNGYNCPQLMQYYGLNKRLIRSEPGVWKGISEQEMCQLYNCFDVQLTTTQGEGWGLTTLEGMACGIPQIVPTWSALGEWATAACQIPCTTTIATVGSVNAIGGVPDRHETILALERLYINKDKRDRMSAASIALAHDEQYRWSTIASRIGDFIEGTIADSASERLKSA